MKINLIVACDNNGVIGKDNKLIWHLPADLQNFRKVTKGHTVIMGRKTFESIGKPLPDRLNIVLSKHRDLKDKYPGFYHVVSSVADALTKVENEVFVIGGSEIYRQFLDKNMIDNIYLTKIDHSFDGDSYFSFDTKKYELVFSESFTKDEKNSYDYSFNIFRNLLK